MKFLREFLCLSFLMMDTTGSMTIEQTSISLTGNASQLEIFDASYLSRGNRSDCTLTSFHLEFAHVHRPALVEYLKDCTNLKSISLLNIVWHPGNGTRIKIHTPNLMTFQFELLTYEGNAWNSRDDFESVFFYTKNSTHQDFGLSLLQNLDLNGSIGNDGYLWIANDVIKLSQVKDQGIWGLLYGILPRFTEISFTRCVLDVSTLDMKTTKTVTLKHNELQNGKMSDILKSTKVAETLTIEVLENEAIDVALLPKQTLVKLFTKYLSFRWSSTSAEVFFPNLQLMKLEYGDVDLNLFKVTDDFYVLSLNEMYLWNSTVDHRMRKLRQLTFSCLYVEGTCPPLVLDSISNSLQVLVLVEVEVILGSLETKFDNLKQLYAKNSRLPDSLVNNFETVFPNVQWLGVDIVDFHRLKLSAIAFSNIHMIMIGVPLGTSARARTRFETSIKTLMNISRLEGNYNGKILMFENEGGHWENVHRYNYDIHKWSRLSKLLKLVGISVEHITQGTLDGMYYSYTAFVYVTCTIGIVCNFLSLTVLMRKSMTSSTTSLLLGLAVSDTLYLMTALVTIEEYQLLFSYTPQRSSFYGYFAYPLNKTAYSASVYLTILITIERFVGICYPFRASSIFTTRRMIRYSLGVLLWAVLLNTPRWFEFVRWNYEASSIAWSSYHPRLLHRFPTYQTLFQKGIWYCSIYVLPFGTIAILNLLIGLEMRRASRARCSVATNQPNGTFDITKLLLTIVFIFFVCNALSAAITWILISKSVEPEVAETFACLPIIVNCSVNFILYYFMGSKFRRELKHVLKSAWDSICQTFNQLKPTRRMQTETTQETGL